MEQASPAVPGGPQADGNAAPATPPPTGAVRAPRRRKRGRGVLIAVGAAIALVAIGWVAVKAGAIGEDGRARSAEGHYDAALASLGRVEDRLAKLDLSQGTSIENRVASFVTSATADMTDAEEELRAAERDIGKTRSEEPRKTYLESTHEMRLGIESLRGKLDYLRRTGGLLDKKNAADKSSADARKAVNEAIELANASKWDASAKKARAAASLFAAAREKLDAAHAADPSAGLDKAAAHAAREREEAELVARMAVLGKRGDVTAYNSLIARTERLRAEMLKIGDPEILSDPAWVQTRLDVYDEVAAEHWRAAERLRAEALRGLR